MKFLQNPSKHEDIQVYIQPSPLKNKAIRATCHADTKRDRRYTSYSFFTSVLDGGVVSITHQLRFTPGKGTPVPIG
jgi:hypothetical protein